MAEESKAIKWMQLKMIMQNKEEMKDNYQIVSCIWGIWITKASKLARNNTIKSRTQ